MIKDILALFGVTPTAQMLPKVWLQVPCNLALLLVAKHTNTQTINKITLHHTWKIFV
jgi:hypothetical protein